MSETWKDDPAVKAAYDLARSFGGTGLDTALPILCQAVAAAALPEDRGPVAWQENEAVRSRTIALDAAYQELYKAHEAVMGSQLEIPRHGAARVAVSEAVHLLCEAVSRVPLYSVAPQQIKPVAWSGDAALVGQDVCPTCGADPNALRDAERFRVLAKYLAAEADGDQGEGVWTTITLHDDDTVSTCKECRFWRARIPLYHLGDCYRYAPKPNSIQMQDASTVWTETHNTD